MITRKMVSYLCKTIFTGPHTNLLYSFISALKLYNLTVLNINEMIHMNINIFIHCFILSFFLCGYKISWYLSKLMPTKVNILTFTLNVAANGAILHNILGNIHLCKRAVWNYLKICCNIAKRKYYNWTNKLTYLKGSNQKTDYNIGYGQIANKYINNKLKFLVLDNSPYD